MKSKIFFCRNCGYEWQVAVLSQEEAEEARRKNQPVSSVRCPKCGSSNLEQHS